MSDERDEMIRSYVSRVMEVRERREGAMRAEELRAIARDIGLSEEDLVAAEQESRDHLTRGRQFVQHNRLDDAIEALRKSVALAPDNVEARVEMASALRARFVKRRAPEDRTRAIEQARLCIDHDPSCQRAYQLLNELDGPSAAPTPSRAAAAAPIIFIVAGIGATMVLGAVGVAFFALRGAPAAPPVVKQLPPHAPIEPPAPIKGAQAPTSTSGIAIPLEVQLPEGSGLEPVTVTSSYDYYESSATGYYRLVYELKNTTSDKKIKRVEGTMTIYGADGQPLLSDSFAPLGGSEPALSPGDSASVSRIKELKQRPARVAVVIKLVDHTLGAPPDDAPAQLAWETASPFKDRLSVSTREFTFNRYGDSAEGYTAIVMALSVSGDTPVRKLTTRLELYDASGKLAKQTSFYPLGVGDGPLRPGTIQLAGGTWSSAEDIASYKVVIEEIE